MSESKHYLVPRGDLRVQPACWSLVVKGEEEEKSEEPVLRCPNPDCSKVYWLDEHEVDIFGNVTPSVVCPFNCGFHAFIRLEQWGEQWGGGIG